MENKLEQLLNSLIEKGYRPFWKKADHCLGCRYNNDWSEMYKYVGFWWWDDVVVDRKVPLRNLVSAESWLWQFVCENGMVKEEHKHERILDTTFWEWLADCKRQEHDWNYWYRVIESALCDEDKLEEFLLDNIKVEWIS